MESSLLESLASGQSQAHSAEISFLVKETSKNYCDYFEKLCLAKAIIVVCTICRKADFATSKTRFILVCSWGGALAVVMASEDKVWPSFTPIFLYFVLHNLMMHAGPKHGAKRRNKLILPSALPHDPLESQAICVWRKLSLLAMTYNVENSAYLLPESWPDCFKSCQGLQ